MVKDPVCGMEMDKKKAEKAMKLKHKGKTYHFCSPTCRWAFKKNPEQFIKRKNKGG